MKSRIIFALAFLAAVVQPVFADAVYQVSMNTAPLIGDASGPFSLEFQFNDGSGLDDGNNTAVVDNFSFGGGSATGTASTFGSVTGDLVSGISFTDNTFFNQFVQGFTPGGSLAFRVTLTTNVDAGGVPDEFSFSILDSSGFEIPTLGLFDAFLVIDVDSSNPSPQLFGSDSSRNTPAGGGPISLDAPALGAPVAPVPESSALGLLIPALAGLAWRARAERNARPERRA